MNEEEELHRHGLKSTRVRKEVLRIIASSTKALSHKEIQAQLYEKADRVTLFRLLHDFEQKGIIHKALDIKGISVYAYCHNTCSEQGHSHSHGHFQCKQCDGVYCLMQTDIMMNAIPFGFIIDKIETIMYGLCKECSTKG
ncbi:MAG: transcriptional repressor [Candidatus Kapabacteria bacterium]|jgi:Fur family ferric uptake transcriptional regulator|nr:transcriptional repressor [Candidatus Kapabacteria bacterium]